MGVDELSVVDPLTMRVHGLDGLRVVDASVLPYVTNGNIYAPVMMVAEKAADLILGDTPLRSRSGRRSTGTFPLPRDSALAPPSVARTARRQADELRPDPAWPAAPITCGATLLFAVR